MTPRCCVCGQFTTNTFKRIPDRFGGFDHDDWYCLGCEQAEPKAEVA